jgi:hypothetical protein
MSVDQIYVYVVLNVLEEAATVDDDHCLLLKLRRFVAGPSTPRRIFHIGRTISPQPKQPESKGSHFNGAFRVLCYGALSQTEDSMICLILYALQGTSAFPYN